jgi:Big-like domain-containing protein
MSKREYWSLSALRLFLVFPFFTAVASANQPPGANLTSPPSGTLLSDGDTIQLQAQAFDAEAAVTKVEFFANGSFLGEDFLPPYSLWWSNIATGVYSLQAVAVDDGWARGTSSVMTITVTSPTPRMLDWNPTPLPNYPALEWNRTSINWRSGGRPTVFHDGDSVNVALVTGFPIFIGIDGVLRPVSPASTIARGNGGVITGDILTGGLTVDFSARVTFSNSLGSLSFPGGTLIQPSPGLTFDVSGASPGATVHFGTGPITNNSSTFTFQTGDVGATLENDFVFPTPGRSTLAINPVARPNAVAHFSGALYLGTELTMQIFSDSAGIPRPYHEWSGPVVLNQSNNRVLRIASGAYYLKGLTISGDIVDGPGDGTNMLNLSAYGGPLRLTGPNTYAHGTRIEYSPFPSGIEVGPNSSLGTGDVETFGNVTLLGNGNMASNANVSLIGGRAFLGRGVKIRVKSLKLGNTVYTNGLFAGTNFLYGNYLASNGSFRLPPMNLNPTVSLTNPVSGDMFVAGDTITMRASASDVDSYITQVEFRLNGSTFAMRTNAPFQASFREAPAGIYALQAIAYDDDGGVGSSSIVIANIQPRIDRILRHPENMVVLEFDAPLLHPYALEAADTLSSSEWVNIQTFPSETSRRRIRATNAIPAEVSTRFYRLMLPNAP